MKSAPLFCLLLSAIVIPPASFAQQPRTRQNRERRGQRADPRVANEKFQVLEFTFTTGDDDLRNDSTLQAHLAFPDGSTQDCPLHGDLAGAQGNDATVTWENHSTHKGAPCHLSTPHVLADLRNATITLDMSGLNLVGDPLHTEDNWNISRVTVIAYNPSSPARSCVFEGSGNPLARMTGGKLMVTDFPNRCR